MSRILKRVFQFALVVLSLYVLWLAYVLVASAQ